MMTRALSLMRMMFTVAVIIGLLCGLLSCGQKTSSNLEEGLALYRQNRLEEALPLLQQAVNQDPKNTDARAWLAETQRRLGKRGQAVKAARKILGQEPCHAFAHTVLAYAYYPVYGQWRGANYDSTWHHLLAAASCDSADGNVWTVLWVEAIRRGELDLATKSVRRMYETEFFTPALLAYNRWMLGHLPKDAVILTNGDMDTYPAVALQEVEGFRQDVVVANRSLLNTVWYARYLRDRHGLPLPFEEVELEALRAQRDESGKLLTVSDQIIRGWMRQRQEGQFSRPIAISATVDDRSFADQTKDHLCLFGPFYLWFPVTASSPQDTAMMRISLSEIDPADFAGHLASEGDRSPVRRAFSDRLVENITAAAVLYGQVLIESGHPDEARKILKWAEEFEKGTQAGPRFAERIKELRK